VTRGQEPRNNAAVTPAQAGVQRALRQAEKPQDFAQRTQRTQRRKGLAAQRLYLNPNTARPEPVEGLFFFRAQRSGTASQCFDKLSTSGCEGQSDPP